MSYPAYTKAVISYIEANITDEKLSIDKLEQQIGLSGAHIRALFRQQTGYSIGRYTKMRKIKRSALDLLHTDRTILDIAFQYGFVNPETYTRAFRRAIGMTPSEFRRQRPLVGKEELLPGIYGVGILAKKERRSDIGTKQKIYRNNDSTILYGVPKVGYGEYGGLTPYPLCLKANANYLGEDLPYYYIMVSCGAAFRFAWNSRGWDLSNVDIYHTFEESSEVYSLAAKALGREFFFLGRDKGVTKEDFMNFIKQHLDEGYPCIALGIIGPPEPCIITGYRKNGQELLGWNFFQAGPEFGGSVKVDDSGYFISDTWWENTDTQAVMCMGAIKGGPFAQEIIIQNGIKALTGRMDSGFYKGTSAYDGWKKAIADEKSFSVGENYYLLFEKMLCQMEAMNCLEDGRSCAAAYFESLSEAEQDKKEQYHLIANAFHRCKQAIKEIRQLFGTEPDEMLKKLADKAVRKQVMLLIDRAKEADIEALNLMKGNM